LFDVVAAQWILKVRWHSRHADTITTRNLT
jgi:hypothetical protein